MVEFVKMELNLTFMFILSIFVISRIHNVSGARMTITPNTVSLIGDTTVPTYAPSTSQVEMMCSADNLGIVEAVYSMYLRRDVSSFAEISAVGVNANTPKFSVSAPNDIKTKAPTLEGSVNNNNPSSSVLRARYLVSRMDCNDQATYHCLVTYKPSSSDTRQSNTSATLTVNVQPRNLQISVMNIQEYNMVQNLSQVTRGAQLELSCNGYIGGSQSTMIEWFRKTYQDNAFRPFYPSQPGDSIDNGVPSLYTCEYSRTSKLRYSISVADSGFTKFRCEVPGLQTSGGAFRAYSHEFHINTGFITIGNSSIRLTPTVSLWTSSLLVFSLILLQLV